MIRGDTTLDERHMRAPYLLPAAALLLSGCTALAELDRSLSGRLNPPPAAPATVAGPAVPLPDRKPPVPRQTVAAKPAKVAATPPKPEPAPAETVTPPVAVAPVPPARTVPATLVGLSSDELRNAMGAPAQEIAEAPGVRWRYPNRVCILDVHLFPRVESQGLYALDVSATGLPVEACLDSFRNPPVDPATDPAAAAAQPAESATAADAAAPRAQ